MMERETVNAWWWDKFDSLVASIYLSRAVTHLLEGTPEARQPLHLSVGARDVREAVILLEALRTVVRVAL